MHQNTPGSACGHFEAIAILTLASTSRTPSLCDVAKKTKKQKQTNNQISE